MARDDDDDDDDGRHQVRRGDGEKGKGTLGSSSSGLSNCFLAYASCFSFSRKLSRSGVKDFEKIFTKFIHSLVSTKCLGDILKPCFSTKTSPFFPPCGGRGSKLKIGQFTQLSPNEPKFHTQIKVGVL